jgi:hypothetical protein
MSHADVEGSQYQAGKATFLYIVALGQMSRASKYNTISTFYMAMTVHKLVNRINSSNEFRFAWQKKSSTLQYLETMATAAIWKTRRQSRRAYKSVTNPTYSSAYLLNPFAVYTCLWSWSNQEPPSYPNKAWQQWQATWWLHSIMLFHALCREFDAPSVAYWNALTCEWTHSTKTIHQLVRTKNRRIVDYCSINDALIEYFPSIKFGFLARKIKNKYIFGFNWVISYEVHI